jgi:hypothetical protein
MAKHWTQTPEGRARLSAQSKRMWREDPAKMRAAIHNGKRKQTRADRVVVEHLKQPRSRGAAPEGITVVWGDLKIVFTPDTIVVTR